MSLVGAAWRGALTRLALLALWVIAQLAHIVASVRMLGFILAGSERSRRILLAYDRLGNAATGGDDRETISSRANRERAKGERVWCILCRVLDWLDKDHCKRSAGT